MTRSLDDSFAWCRALTRRTAGNFYYAFLTLPPDRFRDMCALYAFMRVSDDIGDDESLSKRERRGRLNRWRESVAAALVDDRCGAEPLPAFADVVRRHGIPHRYPLDVIRGIESDLDPVRFETFDDLRNYCYHVAGAVGVCCIHVWGFRDERAIEAAIDCGTAFQITNVLRDVGEDALADRVYLPREDLDRFGYAGIELATGVRDRRFEQLMRFEASRAHDYYERGARLFEYLEPEGRTILTAMIRIYRGLLRKIERSGFDVFERRVRLSRWRKLFISVDSMFRGWWGRSPGRSPESSPVPVDGTTAR